jgi:hypothetical protein
MQDNRIAAVPARVQGLGLCDVLRVVLEPCQICGMIEELEERRGPLHEAFDTARTCWDALDQAQRDGPLGNELQEGLSESAYALRMFIRIRAQVPAVDHDETVALIGPASIITELVAAASRNAVEDLAERLCEPAGEDPERSARLHAAAAAVTAWTSLQAECEDVVWFNFDKRWDPIRELAWSQ